ncbi:class A beta-lactamase [Streptomyces sp. V3I7]|uniref:class A beta-lactamase n=1 Tax=Streptomyces sp. V3I7 TaxID=3042278 RepID=UPI002787A632|nr:class A beta-lactamase [Streptomyces sp. V3I7]MDQ0990545.1 beta-lactamase class A [Streptomyces sp. V3I7]
MLSSGPRPSRRSALLLGAGAAASVALASAGTAHASVASGDDVSAQLKALEREHAARVGVFGRNLRTGKQVAYRADELFPMCSTFKTIAVAAVLRDLDRDGEFLAKRVFYAQADVDKAAYAPVTGLPENLANGMTVAGLCDAAIRYSDNGAANLLFAELGGPRAVTRFCRSIGDGTTRLDRWEPELNSAEPDRVTDTTTPRALGRTYARLVLGDALAPHDRERLTGWLLANTTSGERFRKGIPADWTVADKTGGGRYGTNNDAGIAWTPDGAPVVMTVLTTRFEEAAAADHPLVASTAALLAAALG